MHISLFDKYFYKKKESKLGFGDRVVVILPCHCHLLAPSLLQNQQQQGACIYTKGRRRIQTTCRPVHGGTRWWARWRTGACASCRRGGTGRWCWAACRRWWCRDEAEAAREVRWWRCTTYTPTVAAAPTPSSADSDYFPNAVGRPAFYDLASGPPRDRVPGAFYEKIMHRRAPRPVPRAATLAGHKDGPDFVDVWPQRPGWRSWSRTDRGSTMASTSPGRISSCCPSFGAGCPGLAHHGSCYARQPSTGSSDPGGRGSGGLTWAWKRREDRRTCTARACPHHI